MKNKSVTIRLESGQYDRLTELASSMERPKSFVIEDALTNYLAINEWQINKIQQAVIKANDPKTQWVDSQTVRKDWEQRLEN